MFKVKIEEICLLILNLGFGLCKKWNRGGNITMNIFTYKCPNCNAPLVFEPKDQKFHCDYCLGKFTEAEVTAHEKKQRESGLSATETEAPSIGDDQESQASKSRDESVKENTNGTSTQGDEVTVELFLCPSCGAEIVTEVTTAATYCYYCHNPVVLANRLSGMFLPESLLPFTIEREAAIDTFLAWTRKKWFIPKAFFNKQQINKMTGVYFPYWVIDTEVDGQLNAIGTSIRVWRAGNIEYKETKKFAVTRSGQISFKELIKNALSKNMQQKMVEAVQPFLLAKAIPFKSQYLAGFQAEKRDIEYEEIRQTVEKELQSYAKSILTDTASGYTSLSKVQADISLRNEQNRYMLLPVWIITYRSNDRSKKVYYYAMNGQTGKVSGVLPMSYKRLSIFTSGLFLLLLILFLLGGYFI